MNALLQAGTGAAARAHPTDRTRAEEDALLPDGRPLNAVVLDDNSFDRRRLKRMAERTGLAITFTDAHSLKRLEARLDDGRFDLVFLDYRLPEGDGLEALRMVRSHPGSRDAAAIMISGTAEPEVAVAAMKSGCQDYLAKDRLAVPTLRRAIDEAMAQRAGAIETTLRGMLRAEHGRLLDELRATLGEARSPDRDAAEMSRVVRASFGTAREGDPFRFRDP